MTTAVAAAASEPETNKRVGTRFSLNHVDAPFSIIKLGTGLCEGKRMFAFILSQGNMAIAFPWMSIARRTELGFADTLGWRTERDDPL